MNNSFEVDDKFETFNNFYCQFSESTFNFHLSSNFQPKISIKSNNVDYKIDQIVFYSEKYLYSNKIQNNSKPKTSKEVLTASGSGFLLTKNGHFITNFHVIENAKSIEISFGQKKYSAEIVQVDKLNDLALLKINSNSFISPEIVYSIKSTSSPLGEKVFTLGFPMLDVQGKNLKLTDGIISSKSGFKDDPTKYQISVPLQPGNSGGPLFDYNGNIVGVVNSGILEANSVGYAIKSGYLLNFIDAVDGIELPKGTSLLGKPLTTQVEILSKLCGLVIVEY
jgi:S1-C subfamily serine protease